MDKTLKRKRNSIKADIDLEYQHKYEFCVTCRTSFVGLYFNLERKKTNQSEIFFFVFTYRIMKMIDIKKKHYGQGK